MRQTKPGMPACAQLAAIVLIAASPTASDYLVRDSTVFSLTTNA